MYILFILFTIFTHKQLYAAGHFTGSSRTMPIILRVVSIVNILLEIAFVIYVAFRVTFWAAPLFIMGIYLAGSIVNTIIAKIAVNGLVKDGLSPDDDIFVYSCSRQCDIIFTIIAEVGILANIAIAVYFILTLI